MAIENYKNIEPSDLDRKVWRYLTFSKFISLFTYHAVWFSKLNTLVDQYEGSIPKVVEAEMQAEHQKFKSVLHPSLHEQVDRASQNNVADGRELTLVNCWFLSDGESERMWKEYATGVEGIAIKSTVRSLSLSVFCDPRFSHIGKVQYVDLGHHSMGLYEANQAHERAFLKDQAFAHESEIRIQTMSFKGPTCVGIDGIKLKPEEYQGASMNNFKNPGIYIQTDLSTLVDEIVLAPDAPVWLELLIKRIVQLSGIGRAVTRSSLEG